MSTMDASETVPFGETTKTTINMISLEPETLEALKEYNDILIEMATTMDMATRELLAAQKKLVIAGQGLQGFLKEVSEHRITPSK